MDSEALGKGILGDIWDYLGCFIALAPSSGVFQKPLSHVPNDTASGSFTSWLRATCFKKWLFGGSLCCGAVLGTNCHTWLSSKVMGMEVAPAVC